MTGTSRPLGVSAAKPTLKNFLKIRFWPDSSSWLLSTGNSRMARTAAWMMNASGVTLTPAAAALSLSEPRSALEIGDVRFVELRDMRDVDPRRLQARTGDLLHAVERLDLDFAERGRIVVVRLGQRRRGRGERHATRHHQLDEGLDVIEQDAALLAAATHAAEIDAELARELAHRGRGMRAAEAGFVDGRQAATRGRRSDCCTPCGAAGRGAARRGGFVRRPARPAAAGAAAAAAA